MPGRLWHSTRGENRSGTSLGHAAASSPRGAGSARGSPARAAQLQVTQQSLSAAADVNAGCQKAAQPWP